MQVAEALGEQAAQAWSAEEERNITTIQQTESVPRAEAIRRMQRHKKAARALMQRSTAPSTQRLCRNPRCTRGDGGGPGSLAHLRADALYCNATCKKAGQRSSKRLNRPSDRQYSCGAKGDKFGSLRSPYGADEHAP
jgi:hypothetical protein